MSVNAINQDELQREVPKRETLARLYRYMFRYKRTLAAVLALVTVTLAVSLATPLLIEKAVDGYVAEGNEKGLLALGTAGFVLFLIFMAGTRGRMLLMEKVTNRVLLTIRQELYIHIQSLDFHFFDSRPTGKILARVVGDVNSLKEMYSDSVTKLLPDLLTVIGVAVIMLVKNWRLALAALLTVPFLAGGMMMIQGRAHRLWQIHRKKNSNLNAFIHENFSGIRIVQSFAAEPETSGEFQSCNEAYRASFIDAVRIADLFSALVEITWGAGGFLLYYIGIRVIGAEQIGVGTFMAFSTYLAMFWSPVRNLASFYNKIITNLSAAEQASAPVRRFKTSKITGQHSAGHRLDPAVNSVVLQPGQNKSGRGHTAIGSGQSDPVYHLPHPQRINKLLVCYSIIRKRKAKGANEKSPPFF